MTKHQLVRIWKSALLDLARLMRNLFTRFHVIVIFSQAQLLEATAAEPTRCAVWFCGIGIAVHLFDCKDKAINIGYKSELVAIQYFNQVNDPVGLRNPSSPAHKTKLIPTWTSCEMININACPSHCFNHIEVGQTHLKVKVSGEGEISTLQLPVGSWTRSVSEQCFPCV